jgi:hypothetical protein
MYPCTRQRHILAPIVAIVVAIVALGVLSAFSPRAGAAVDSLAQCNPYLEQCPRNVKAWVQLKVRGKKCERRDFIVTPTIKRADIKWARLKLNGKTLTTVRKPPYRFTVPIDRVRRGSRNRLTLVMNYLQGPTITVGANFHRCR